MGLRFGSPCSQSNACLPLGIALMCYVLLWSREDGPPFPRSLPNTQRGTGDIKGHDRCLGIGLQQLDTFLPVFLQTQMEFKQSFAGFVLSYWNIPQRLILYQIAFSLQALGRLGRYLRLKVSYTLTRHLQLQMLFAVCSCCIVLCMKGDLLHTAWYACSCSLICYFLLESKSGLKLIISVEIKKNPTELSWEAISPSPTANRGKLLKQPFFILMSWQGTRKFEPSQYFFPQNFFVAYLLL